VTPVVDYLETRHDVDADKLALVGISYGGLLALIAASQEHRFRAVLAFDGIYNLGKLVEQQFQKQFPPQVMELFSSGNRTTFDAAMNKIRLDTSTPSLVRWVIDQGLFAFNTTSPFDWMTRFTALGIECLTDTVKGPVFIGSGQDDDSTLGQPEMLTGALGNRSHYVLFETDVGAGEHAQIGAASHLAQTAFDWAAKYFE
jgi:pimeloyl-ACP methyl ester carboxylesterase